MVVVGLAADKSTTGVIERKGDAPGVAEQLVTLVRLGALVVSLEPADAQSA